MILIDSQNQNYLAEILLCYTDSNYVDQYILFSYIHKHTGISH